MIVCGKGNKRSMRQRGRKILLVPFIPPLFLFLFLVPPWGVAAGIEIHWRHPGSYTDQSAISDTLRATLETRLYYSVDRSVWNLLASIPEGGNSWIGPLPVEEGRTAYYAATTTIPGEGVESALSEIVAFPVPPGGGGGLPGDSPAGPGDEVTVRVGNSTDTTVNVGSESNFSESPYLYTYTWPAGHVANRSFIKWDLSAVPPDAAVGNASLWLYFLTEQGSGGDNPYRVDVAKVQGSDPDLSSATWQTRDGIYGWSGGADGGASDLAPAESSVAVGMSHGWISWNVTNMVRDWLADPWTNYGMAIEPDRDTGVDSNRGFASREHPDPELHPRLVISYRQGGLDQGEGEQPGPVGVNPGFVPDRFRAEIRGSEDTFVNHGTYANDNYFSESTLNTYTWPENHVANRGFIQWNLSGLPEDITVSQATLWLYYVAEDHGGGDGEYTVNVSKVSGVKPDLRTATWNGSGGATPWPGGADGGSSAIGPPGSSATIGSKHRWVSWDITEMVREWVADPATNFGMAIDSDGSASSDSNRYFASREYPDPGLRPWLEITYTRNR